MLKNILILTIVFVVIFVGYNFINKPSTDVTEDKDAEVTENEEIEDAMVDEEKTLTADLEDVSGGTSSGNAIITRSETGLEHSVTANLPDPTGTDFYEGWLVKREPELMFVSTGDLVKNEDGTYSLSYSSEELYEGYDFVVITLETVKDATPEKHIIEGLAE